MGHFFSHLARRYWNLPRGSGRDPGSHGSCPQRMVIERGWGTVGKQLLLCERVGDMWGICTRRKPQSEVK